MSILKKVIRLFSKDESLETKIIEPKDAEYSSIQTTELTLSAEVLKKIGNEHFERGDLAMAEQYYKHALDVDPTQFAICANLGVAKYHQGKLEEAVKCYDQAIALKPDNAEAYSNRGLALNDLKRFEDALVSLDRAIELKSNFEFAFNNQGITLKNLNRFEEALDSYNRAIELKPDYAEAYNNRGVVLMALIRHGEALESYNRAIELKPDYAEAYSNQGMVLVYLRRLDEALKSCDFAILINPDFASAYVSRAYALFNLCRSEDALVSINRAISLEPDLSEAYLGRGIVLKSLLRFEEALTSLDRVISLESGNLDAHINRASVLKFLNRPDEALKSYERGIELNPNQEFLYGSWLEIKKLFCDWTDHDKRVNVLEKKINEGKNVSLPFIVLSLTYSAALQRKAAGLYGQAVAPANDFLPSITKYPRHDKIRIGYFSADFRNHAVSFLTAELFETHDKLKFEIVAFSFSRSKDKMTQRLTKAFDQFIDLSNQSDVEVALMARSMEIDIAIDLGGLSGGGRLEAFALRVAPVQVNYLGYPGTMGVEYMDYIIADSTLIPLSHQQYYSEKVVYLPSFQANDTKRYISSRKLSREELGLPSIGFVFCCFNNLPKINPTIFDVWMRVLKQVEGSVLWLLHENATAVTNLRKEAVARGVDGNRLVFAQREILPDYLARYRIADLFLDTLPFNAGTTASDALWAELPVLTQIGESFSGRMAASLLNAIRLPELITSTQDEYVELAVELATNPDKLAKIKQKLADNRLTTPLFDIEYFTKNIESAYTKMYERYHAGLPPDHIYTANHKTVRQ